MDLTVVITQAMSGVTAAIFLFLTAVGLSLIFGVVRVLNFAHGSFYMIGAYAAFQMSKWLGTGNVGFWAGALGAALIVMLIVFILAHLLLQKTKLGRYAYAIGGNEEAAILSGVNVRLYKTLIYGLCSGLSGLAAVLLTARLNSAQPIAGMMYELDAIAATVIGGTSLMGGEGNVFGTLVGALIIGVLRNGLTLLYISSFSQQIIIGLVIIIAVLLDMALKKSKR